MIIFSQFFNVFKDFSWRKRFKAQEAIFSTSILVIKCVCQCFSSWIYHLILNLNKKTQKKQDFTIFFRFLACSGGFLWERAPKLMDYLIFWAYWTKNQSHCPIRFDDLFSYSLNYRWFSHISYSVEAKFRMHHKV